MDFSKNFKQVIKDAKKRARKGLIEPNDLLASIILNTETTGYKLLHTIIDTNDAKKQIDLLYKNSSDEKNENDKAELSTLSEQIMLQSHIEAKIFNSNIVKTEHLVLSFVKTGYIKNISYEETKKELERLYNMDESDSDEFDDTIDNNSQKTINMNKTTTKTKNETPILDEFTTDFTKLALDGKLDPIVGRESELRRIAQILSRRKKNNPVLIGQPGVGKTAIIEGLAQNIVNRTVPECLYNKRILSLEMGSLVAGTKYRGEFEERMKKLVDELRKTENIILYVDEIHTMVGAGSSSGSLDAANILKPALARGEISCIGSTTLDEYRKIEKDGALERRFQKVIVNEPTYDETRQILYNLKPKYEDFHNVEYTNDAIEACLKLSHRYITERNFPDKAIDALDEAGSSVRIKDMISQEIIILENKLQEIINSKLEKVDKQDFEGAASDLILQHAVEDEIELYYKTSKEKKNTEVRRKVTAEDVAEVVSTITGIPSKNISEDDSTKLTNLGKEIKSEVVGQDEAVDKIVRSVLRNKAGLSDMNKPIGTFLFLGPTGVGKTFLAKILAKKLFTSDKDMIRFDMSEFMEKHTVSRLIGSPPGYVGYDDAGQLTEAVRRNPYSIILLDEIEKAHSDVYNILLQIFEDGILTDGQGKTVNFKNAVIIMTSNIGSKETKERGSGVGFTQNTLLSNSITERALKNKFAPEFLNRIDAIIKFESLGENEIKRIIDLELNKFISRLNDNGLDIELDEEAKKFLFEKGWDENLGARPLKRAIQQYLEDEISIMLIMKQISKGNTIYVTKKEGLDILSFTSSTNLLDIPCDEDEESVEKD